MNLEEKAGTMFITMINMKKDGSISEKPFLGDFFSFFVPGTSQMLFGKKLNHFNILSTAGKKHTAEWYNHIQKLAERTRLGIPVTISAIIRLQVPWQATFLFSLNHLDSLPSATHW
jgi:beta-glucosidase